MLQTFLNPLQFVPVLLHYNLEFTPVPRSITVNYHCSLHLKLLLFDWFFFPKMHNLLGIDHYKNLTDSLFGV